MARQYKSPTAKPHEIQKRVEEHFTDPILAFLRTEIILLLKQHESAVNAGGTPSHGAIESLFNYYQTIFPSNLGPRFALDAWLIQNISESWSQGSIKLPRTILPLYGSEWMWQRLPWMEESDRSGQRIYAITIKGRNQLNSIHLLEYPWLCHELGHALFSKAPAAFLAQFVSVVDNYCQPLLRKAFSDSPEVRSISRINVEQIRKRWIPRGDQQSWIHEIAVDLIALWNCGPAFLAAMMDAAANVDPFIVDTPHPPYALRLKILALCAENLGWNTEAMALFDSESKWISAYPVTSWNRYIALCPTELINAALSWASRACIEWKIPKCDRDLLTTYSLRRQQNAPIDSANELIVSAWLMFDKNHTLYADWENEAVRSLCNELNGDAGDSV